MPALKIEHEPARGAHLRLVRTTHTPSARRHKANAAAYEAFVTFCVLIAVLALAALGRVWLSAEAAHATRQSAELREQIKTARYEGDLLEVQKTRLSAAGRVKRIAATQLGMAIAEKTAYIDLRAVPSAKRSVAIASEPKTSGPGGLATVLDSVVGVAAGEARVLLVGDVGLSSSR